MRGSAWVWMAIALAGCECGDRSGYDAGSDDGAVRDGGSQPDSGRLDAGFDPPNEGTGCLAPGVCYENPLPHGLLNRYVWPNGERDVWASSGNFLTHWDGTATSLERPDAGIFFGGIYGPTPELLFAARGGGVATRTNGRGWSETTLITEDRTFQVLDLHGTAADDVWAVGYGGIAHFDGVAWTVAQEAMFATAIFARTRDDAWAGGLMGELWHWDGTSWASVDSGTNSGIVGIWAPSADEAWITTQTGGVRRWTPGGVTSDSRVNAVSVAGTDGSVYFAQATGTVVRFDGTDFAPIDNPRGARLYLLRSNGAEVWGAGDGGVVARLTPDGVDPTYDDDTDFSHVYDVAFRFDDGVEGWARTVEGNLLRREGEGPRWRVAGSGALTSGGDRLFLRAADDPWLWSDVSVQRFDLAAGSFVPVLDGATIGATARIGGACALDGSVLAVVSRGASGHEAWLSSDLSTFESETIDIVAPTDLGEQFVSSVFCHEGGEAWAIGEAHGEERLWHREPDGSWTRVGFGYVASVDVFAASEDDAWALTHYSGSSVGTVVGLLHFDGVLWRWDRSVPELERATRLVGSSPNDVWIVGEGGFAAHWDGAGWARADAPRAGDLVTAIDDGGVLHALDTAGDRYRFDGAWSVTTTTKPASFMSYVEPTLVRPDFAIGAQALSYRLDGDVWTEVTWPESMPSGIEHAVADATGAWILDDGGSLYRLEEPTGFVRQGGFGTAGVIGVAVVEGSVRVVLENGVRYARSGTTWTMIDDLGPTPLFYATIADTGQGLIASSPTHTYVDRGARLDSIASLRAPISLTRGGDGVWRAIERDGRVVRVAGGGGATVLATLDLGSRVDEGHAALATSDEDIFVLERTVGTLERYDGTELVDVLSPALFRSSDFAVAGDGRIWVAGPGILRLD